MRDFEITRNFVRPFGHSEARDGQKISGSVGSLVSRVSPHSTKQQTPSCGNSNSVPWGCRWGAGWLGYSVGTSEPFGRGLDTVALGGPPVFTSELIGEDSLAGH